MLKPIRLEGCTITPFGSYLKGLGVLRLIGIQEDAEARGWWDGNGLSVETTLTEESLLTFFLQRYRPTPVLAPWNGGSGFYAKDNKTGIEAIAGSTDPRLEDYRGAIAACRAFEEVVQGKIEKDAKAEDERRSIILRRCRNELSDSAVEWLDAAIGIASDGSRAFAPVVGTGGNEGRLDYTNNFMARVASLLLSPGKTPGSDLLHNALFGTYTTALQNDSAGQFNPGRAGGANQGQGIESDSPTNPWDFILTIEGAVAWASGLYRRHGVSYRSFLCSPFTVKAASVGYGSASSNDDARAEIWAPVWRRPTRFCEIKVLLREGRAVVNGRAAADGLQFAEAATSLGVDRSIDQFVRYSLLKRRGDSYVALPAGIFAAEYRTESDRIRELSGLIDALNIPPGCEALRRRLDSSIYETLLRGGSERLRDTVASLGRLLRRIVTTSGERLPAATLPADAWLDHLQAEKSAEVRIAAGLASLYDSEAGSIRDNLTSSSRTFAWTGNALSVRLLSVLDRRLRSYSYEEGSRPFSSKVTLHSGDASLFIEGNLDDDLVEDLLFAFTCLRWDKPRAYGCDAMPIPAYVAVKYLFRPDCINNEYGESKRLKADARIPSLLTAGHIERATAIAIERLRIAGLRPIEGAYSGGMDAMRLGAALLIPAFNGFSRAILKPKEKTFAVSTNE